MQPYGNERPRFWEKAEKREVGEGAKRQVQKKI